MPIQVRYYTDPACPWSWGAEPKLRRLLWEFEGQIEIRPVLGGLARALNPSYRDSEGAIGSGRDRFADLTRQWLQVAAETRMPLDPRIWSENPIAGTYPACMGVKAAAEQGSDAALRYLRALREGLMAQRRKLDHLEALVELARAVGLDVERFRIDAGSHAILEDLGMDLDEVRHPPQEAREAGAVRETEGHERVAFPSLAFVATDGTRHGVWGPRPLEEMRVAALAAGATVVNDGALEPLDAVRRFGRIAGVEAEVLAGRPAPPVNAELWRLAAEWKLRPVELLTGTMWEAA